MKFWYNASLRHNSHVNIINKAFFHNIKELSNLIYWIGRKLQYHDASKTFFLHFVKQRREFSSFHFYHDEIEFFSCEFHVLKLGSLSRVKIPSRYFCLWFWENNFLPHFSARCVENFLCLFLKSIKCMRDKRSDFNFSTLF